MALPALEPLLQAVRERSTGLGSPIHGERHWRTVAATGLWLAQADPLADREIVFLFALLHDAMRESDGYDPEHGPRAAALAADLHVASLIRIGGEELELLQHACAEHADGLVSPDPTVGACWDADRLDLPRVGITPDPSLLSTARAIAGRQPALETPGWTALYAEVDNSHQTG